MRCGDPGWVDICIFGNTISIKGGTMTEVYMDSRDVGKKVYKVRKTYTITTEEFVKVAEGQDPFDVWLDQGGIDYDKVNRDILNEGMDTQAYYAEAFDGGDHEIEYMGMVEEVTDEDDPDYKEIQLTNKEMMI